MCSADEPFEPIGDVIARIMAGLEVRAGQAGRSEGVSSASALTAAPRGWTAAIVEFGKERRIRAPSLVFLGRTENRHPAEQGGETLRQLPSGRRPPTSAHQANVFGMVRS